MQPTNSEESSGTGTDSRVQPTKEQVEFSMGFEKALGELYAQRGAPLVVRARSQSTLSELDPSVTSNSASALSAERPRQSSSSGESSVTCSAVSTSVGSRSLPATVTDVEMVSADSPAAAATIPLCVTRLTSNDLDYHLLNDEPEGQRVTIDRHSTGRKKVC